MKELLLHARTGDVGASLAFLVAAIVLMALLFITHAFVVSRVFADSSELAERLLALFLPPAALVFSWNNGRRKVVVFWVCLLVGYVILRFFAG